VNLNHPRDINQARLLANIASRAFSLFQDGYRCCPFETCPYLFVVLPPAPDTVGYVVDIHPDHPYCSCPCFARHQVCKHYLAVVEEAALLARVAEREREQEYADHPVFGCEPDGGEW